MGKTINGEGVPVGIHSGSADPDGSTNYIAYFTGINSLPFEMQSGRY